MHSYKLSCVPITSRIQRSLDRDAACWRYWSQKSWSVQRFKAHPQPGSWWVWSPTWRLGSLSHTTVNMVEKLRSFNIDHVPRQQNMHVDALASLAASLALPARATEKVLVYGHDLYYPKFAFEESQTLNGDLQVKKFWTPQQVWNSEIGDSHSFTLSYTTSCLMTSKRQPPSEKGFSILL